MLRLAWSFVACYAISSKSSCPGLYKNIYSMFLSMLHIIWNQANRVGGKLLLHTYGAIVEPRHVISNNVAF